MCIRDRSFFHNEGVPFWLLLYGSAGQIIFTLRFIYQWYYSYRRHHSILPIGFWIISLVGSGMIVSYAIFRHDPVPVSYTHLFGTNALRFGRRLQKGFVVTDEPGIYFIPALIDDWKKNGTNAQFLNFDKIDEYRDFGGIRIEDDVLITDEGCRFIGSKRIPYHVEDVEEFMRSREA